MIFLDGARLIQHLAPLRIILASPIVFTCKSIQFLRTFRTDIPFTHRFSRAVYRFYYLRLFIYLFFYMKKLYSAAEVSVCVCFLIILFEHIPEVHPIPQVSTHLKFGRLFSSQ